MAYVTPEIIKGFAEVQDSSPLEVWEILAASASLVFDRACQVEENFFGLADETAEPSDKFFNFEPSGFYRIPPFIEDLIVTINETDEVIEAENYQSRDGYLVFSPYYASNSYIASILNTNSVFNYLKLNAKWGFAVIPADIKQAVIEQALFMWRRKDAAFTELSGVSTAVVQQQLSPTCAFVAEKYREKYLSLSV